MKVIILAGGFGTRLSEYTEITPKPMVKVGDKPIIMHIMNHYAEYGHKDFLIALGYKSSILKDYFLNYKEFNSDFSINLKSGEKIFYKEFFDDWSVGLIDTGIHTMTGGRLKRLKNHIGSERFMMTYGDGVSNVDINALLDFHQNHGKLVTMTAVRPGAKFGELTIKNDQIVEFEEKPQLGSGWINGGFFVMEPKFLEYIDDDETMLERSPIENAAKDGQVMAFKHDEFWHCMDTKKDHDELELLWETGERPWLKNVKS